MMKIAPFVRAAADYPNLFEHALVHTGQHYDFAMSEVFFRDLGMPAPAFALGVGSGSPAEQVGRTMAEFEKVVRQWRPDWVVVVGDVNATCACAITARKENIRLAHIEAGLRSFDRSMPEEINRLVADRMADLLFTPDETADVNLRREGAAPARIKRVGNVMIDTLERHRAAAAAMDLQQVVRSGGMDGQMHTSGPDFRDGAYALVTLHRPQNVDQFEVLSMIVRFLREEVSVDLPVIWPVHPRTRKQLVLFDLLAELRPEGGVVLTEPLGYLELLRLNMQAAVVLTDSGGLQEECCVLGTPCLTLRPNTERPITLREQGGTCLLVGSDLARMRAGYREARAMRHIPCCPPLWDGHAAERIVSVLIELRDKEQGVRR